MSNCLRRCPKYGTPMCNEDDCKDYVGKGFDPNFGMVTDFSKTIITSKPVENFERVK